MKRNTRSGTVYTNQGGAAQAGPHTKAGRPIVGCAIENLAALGAGKAQPTWICAQNASANTERSRAGGRGSFGCSAILGITGRQIDCAQTHADEQAPEAEGLNIGPRSVRFAFPIVFRAPGARSRSQAAADLEVLKVTPRCIPGRLLEENDSGLEAKHTVSAMPTNAGPDQSQMDDLPEANALDAACEHSISGAVIEDTEILRLCAGIGYIASTTVLEP